MPNMKVMDMAGKEVGEITLSDAVFGREVNGAVLHIAVKSYLANQRQGTQSTKTRTEVSGGGKKPWKQKGTGRARQGSTRAPQWTHGGVVFAPKPRSYRVTLNKKVRQLALKSALSAKAAATISSLLTLSPRRATRPELWSKCSRLSAQRRRLSLSSPTMTAGLSAASPTLRA